MSSRTLRLRPGQGRIVLRTDGYSTGFSEMSAMYPLKLLSPQLPSTDVPVVYMMSYGGGLVGGDCVELEVDVQDGARLAILSQVTFRSAFLMVMYQLWMR